MRALGGQTVYYSVVEDFRGFEITMIIYMIEVLKLYHVVMWMPQPESCLCVPQIRVYFIDFSLAKHRSNEFLTHKNVDGWMNFININYATNSGVNYKLIVAIDNSVVRSR